MEQRLLHHLLFTCKYVHYMDWLVKLTPKRSSGLYLLVFGMQIKAGGQAGLYCGNVHFFSSALQGG